jgi:NADH-quinone oxidoreductase subunit G
VLLPIAPFAETSGTFVNAEGQWQSFQGAVEPMAEARPAWKVLRVMGNLFDCAGFDYVTSAEVLAEVKTAATNVTPNNEMSWSCPNTLVIDAQGIESIVDRGMYAGDGLVRRANSLQNVSKARQIAFRVNQAMASNAGLTNGEQAMAKSNTMELTLPVIIDERVPDGGVLVSSLLAQGTSAGEVTLSRV